LNWLSATGTGILLAAILSGMVMGLSFRKIVSVYGRTIVKVRFSLLTIAAMLAIGMLTRYSGLDATMGLAFARTGHLYPFFGTLLGWLGVALPGRTLRRMSCSAVCRNFGAAGQRFFPCLWQLPTPQAA